MLMLDLAGEHGTTYAQVRSKFSAKHDFTLESETHRGKIHEATLSG